MNIQELSKELIEQITSGASESDVIQILSDELQGSCYTKRYSICKHWEERESGCLGCNHKFLQAE